MNIKRWLCAAAALLLALQLAACGKKTQPEQTTAAPITLPAVEKLETTTAPPAANDASQPETTFAFDEDAAVYLGRMNSDVYGKLYLYCQDDHLAIFDSFNELLFLTEAHGYIPAPFEDEDRDPDAPEAMICEDLNFDGVPDIRLYVSSTGLNDYYDCWLWDAEARNYEFFRPLSSIPGISTDVSQRRVLSYNRLNAQNAIVTEYAWQGAELLPVSHREVNNGSDTLVDGPEDVDTPLAIFDGMQISGVSLTGNADSDSRWMCRIENEGIVALYDEAYNSVNREYRFSFVGLQPGTTTVVLKYATSWDAAHIADKILNITVQSDMTLRITQTE